MLIERDDVLGLGGVLVEGRRGRGLCAVGHVDELPVVREARVCARVGARRDDGLDVAEAAGRVRVAPREERGE